LRKHDVPYLHMKEMMSTSGPFSKWLPRDQHSEEVRDFFIDVVEAIKISDLQSYNTVVRLLDLDKFNKKFGLRLKAYPLAVYGCMARIYKAYPEHIIRLVFDRMEKVDNLLKIAKKYSDGDPVFRGMLNYIVPVPLSKWPPLRSSALFRLLILSRGKLESCI